MSEDNDFWLDDPTPSQAGMAFIAMLAGFAWLICLPFDLFARLRDGRHPQDDAQGLGADWGGEHLHNDNAGAA